MLDEKFLRKQKILHLATVDSHGVPHLVPVWYKYIAKKFYIGTNTKTVKAKNITKTKMCAFVLMLGFGLLLME